MPRGVEGAHHIARPLLVPKQPVQQKAHALVRIDKTPIFRHRANAVGVAVRHQPSMAFFFHHGFLQQRDMRQNRLRINTREQRIHFLANRDVPNVRARQIFRENSAPRAIHRVNGKFEIRAADEIQIRELQIAAT